MYSHWQSLCIGVFVRKMLSDCLKRGERFTRHAVFLLGLLFSQHLTQANPAPSVGLSWDPSSDPTVTGYNVYYGASSRGYTNIVPVGSSTSAVVSNLAAGVTYYFAATTYNAVGVESDYSAEASFAVPSPNVPPTLDALTNLTIVQDAGQQVVNLTGISAGASNSNQTLSVSAFSSNPGLIPNPAVNYSSPADHGTLTFTSAPGSFGSAVLTVMVDNGGTVSNTVIRSFMVTVNPVDNPPTIDLHNDVTVNENCGNHIINLTGITCGSTNAGASLNVTAVSSNPSLIPNPSVDYSSPDRTAVLNLAPITNTFGFAKITVTVTDGQPTNNSASMSFSVVVNQIAIPPTIITNVSVAPNSTFRYLIKPPAGNNDNFKFTLGTVATTLGANIVNRKGSSWLVWTPSISQASTTNLINITMTDLSNSSLSTTQGVGVSVLDYLSVGVGSAVLQAGQNGSVPLSLYSSEGVTNLSITLPWSTNIIVNPTLSISAAGVAASSVRAQGTNLLVNIQMAPGAALLRSNVFGSLFFQTVASQPSSFINLPVGAVTAIKPNSQPYAITVSSPGQVVVVNNLAILQLVQGPGPARRLTVNGRIGNVYQIQYSTNLGSATPWLPLTTYTQTSVSQSFTLDPSLPVAIYRVQQR